MTSNSLIFLSLLISNAFAGTVLVTFTAKVEYEVTYQKSTSTSIKEYYKSTSFARKYNQLDLSGSVEASYGSFSGAASFTYGKVEENENSGSLEKSTEMSSATSYYQGYQIWRKVFTSLCVDGVCKKYDEKTLKNTSPSPVSMDWLHQQAVNDLYYNYLQPMNHARTDSSFFSKSWRVPVNPAAGQLVTEASQWLWGKWGETLSCPAGYLATGVCGSGKNHDCGNSWHKLQCTKYSGVYWSGGKSSSKGYKWGKTAYCPVGQAYCARCGSGENDDCGTNVWHTMQCCTPTGVRVSGECQDFSLRYGVTHECPAKHVLTSTCGSGSNDDCQSNWVTGKCCKLI